MPCNGSDRLCCPRCGCIVTCGCKTYCGDDNDTDGPGTCKGLPENRNVPAPVEIVIVPRRAALPGFQAGENP